MTTNAGTVTEYVEEFVMYDEDDNDIPPHFECNVCHRDVDTTPCPDHAPTTDLPGLRLADCTAEPRHYVWAHDRDDYGFPCPLCRLNNYHAAETAARQCQHSGWRRWRVTSWAASKAYTLGVIPGHRVSWGDGHDRCVTFSRLHGRRPYILGVPRDTWRCWRAGHRRGVDIGVFGFCGKCVPWSCCGSTREDHNTGCGEQVAR